MDKSHRHFILYAKYHYQRNDVLSDLITLLSERCCMDRQYVKVEYINSILLEIVYPLIEKRGNPIQAFKELIYEMNRSSIGEACLSFLTITPVKDFPFELGEADPRVLPLSPACIAALKQKG